MARKGWDNLTPRYRQRLLNKGITRAQYESGTSLKKARGHETPTGIGEKRYRALIKKGERLRWPNTTAREVIDAELQRGTDPNWLNQRLSEKEVAEQAYKQWLRENGFHSWFDAKKAHKEYRGPGHQQWQRRRLSVAVEAYWYH